MQREVAVVINRAVGSPLPRSLSLTEPKSGYPKTGDPILNGATWTAGTPGVDGSYNPPIDIPFDYNPSIQTDSEMRAELLKNGVNRSFRRVHLQRLANPLLPWNKLTNPYLTIDSMAVPLTVFNGVQKGIDDGTIAPIQFPVLIQQPSQP